MIYHPTTPLEAVTLRKQNADTAVYLAGGTDDLRLNGSAQGKDLIDRAKILKEVIALVLVLQRKNCFKKLVNSFCVYFLVHDIVPPVLHLSKVCGNLNA